MYSDNELIMKPTYSKTKWIFFGKNKKNWPIKFASAGRCLVKIIF